MSPADIERALSQGGATVAVVTAPTAQEWSRAYDRATLSGSVDIVAIPEAGIGWGSRVELCRHLERLRRHTRARVVVVNASPEERHALPGWVQCRDLTPSDIAPPDREIGPVMPVWEE